MNPNPTLTTYCAWAQRLEESVARGDVSKRHASMNARESHQKCPRNDPDRQVPCSCACHASEAEKAAQKALERARREEIRQMDARNAADREKVRLGALKASKAAAAKRSADARERKRAREEAERRSRDADARRLWREKSQEALPESVRIAGSAVDASSPLANALQDCFFVRFSSDAAEVGWVELPPAEIRAFWPGAKIIMGSSTELEDHYDLVWNEREGLI